MSMDPRLLEHYNRELAHLREMGAEFAEQFPKVAGRLGMAGIEVADPYVERLLEGTAFLAARVQLKLAEEFPRFSQRLMQMLCPHLLAPTPAMLIAQLTPDAGDAGLAKGVTVPRHAALLSRRHAGMATACEFRTAAPVTLWPLRVTDVRYLSQPGDLPAAGLPFLRRIRGVLRVRLKTTAGVALSALSLDTLHLCFAGSDEVAYRLHELVTGSALGVLLRPARREAGRFALLPPASVRAVGFDDAEAMLPMPAVSFAGYRLLQEYFAFPRRFLFADIGGLTGHLRQLEGDEVDLDLLLGQGDGALEQKVGRDDVALHCVPAINLFPKRTGRTLVSDGAHEFHVVPDRSRPLDFEVHSVLDVRGYASGNTGEQVFRPFYAAFNDARAGDGAYYTAQREPRLLPRERRAEAGRSGYVGSEVFVSIVDAAEAPYRRELRQLAFQALCTNRDLPLLMPLGGGASDFVLDHAAPVTAVHCLKGPSRPHAPATGGAVPWRLIDQMSLNYLSLLEAPDGSGAAALRRMLMLYAPAGVPDAAALVNGLLDVSAVPVVRRLPMRGPIAFGRGLEVALTADDLAFQGNSAYLMGMVLERFLARYVSVNTFVQTVLRTSQRGEIRRFEPRCGTRPIH